MAAIYDAFRLCKQQKPGTKCVQFGFPYTDTIKIQQKFGSGVHFYERASVEDLDRLQQLISSGEPINGIFCEFPSNPLLVSPDLKKLRELADLADCPLIIDDTIGSFVNVNVLDIADVVVTSLTKMFSGQGNVMGGSLLLNPNGRHYKRLHGALDEIYEDIVCGEDAIILEANSRDYEARTLQMGRTAEAICDYLAGHPMVERVYYPKYQRPELYNAFKRSGGTYGPLFSVLIKDAPAYTATFFDQLRVCKGPNLGTNFTLACPYTILAHYEELDTVESQGVSRYLVRVSAGLEKPADLVQRFAEALSIPMANYGHL